MTLRANATTQQVKTCSKCRLEKPISEFCVLKNNKLYSWCKKCEAAAHAAYYARPEIKAARAAYTARPDVKAARAVWHTAYLARPDVKAIQKAYNARPDVKVKKAAYHRARNSGFVNGDFETALAIQQNRCGICRHLFIESELTPQKLTKSTACADHDHITKKPRGVLCTQCNTGIGNFQDSPALLEAAIAYLRNPPLDLV